MEFIVHRQFLRSMSALDEYFSFIQGFNKKAEIDETISFLLEVVGEELLTNAIRHSSGGPTISLTLALRSDDLMIEFIDHGAPEYDVSAAELPDLDVPIERRRLGGMGLHIVRQFANKLSYKYCDGDGVITIHRKLERPDVQR